MPNFRNLPVFTTLSFPIIAFPIIVFSTIVITTTPAMSASTALLTQQQISQTIIGKVLNAKRMGMSVRILYKLDKTVSMKLPLMAASGTWRLNGNAICMMMKSGPRRGKTCVTFQHLGGNKYRNSEGINFTIQK